MRRFFEASWIALPLFVVSFAAFPASSLLSQQPTPPAAQQGAEQNNVESRAIWITARKQDGTPAELSASGLQVKIDGKPVSVNGMRRLRPALNYCLLLDTSGSTHSTLAAQRGKIAALLSKIPQAGRDYGRLVAFSGQSFVDAEGTDPKKLAKALNNEISRGPTALYDAVVACSENLSKADSSKSPPDALRLIFIFSDGEDNASHISRDEVERTVISAGIRVYAIGEKDTGGSSPSATAKGIETLKRLSDLSGGKHYFPGKKMDSEQTLADISGDLASLYAVTLTPDNRLRSDRSYNLRSNAGRRTLWSSLRVNTLCRATTSKRPAVPDEVVVF
jgi:Mg-chelatase subunit ChlD